MFEYRYNKYTKNLVRDVHRPEVNLSVNLGVDVDVACNYDTLEPGVLSEGRFHTCVLSSVIVRDRVSVQHFEDLLIIECPVRDPDDLSVYRITHIMGKHFKSGEWGMNPRCGTVITCFIQCVINGRSFYVIVLQLVKLDIGDRCPGYVTVLWFNEPVYVNSLCPRVNLNGVDIEKGGRFESDTDHTDRSITSIRRGCPGFG